MFWQCIKMALKAIASNRMRAFLTMLGIIVGVLALVVLVSLVTSAGDAVTEQVEGLGTDLIRVTVNNDGGRPLRLDELSAFTYHEDIGAVAPLNQQTIMARNGHESGRATISGTTPSYYGIAGLNLIAGRFIRSADVDNNTHVAVIAERAAEHFFGTPYAVGAEISLDGRPFLVVGVVENQDSLMNLLMPGHTIYVPYTTAVRMSEILSNAVTTLLVSASGTDMLAAEEAIEEMLLDRFRRDDEAFGIFNQALMAEAMDEITSMLTTLLAGVAAVSLLVGGIGIMNIMLVSVTERTKEIGVRKAIGAGRGSIMLQFLVEALVLSLLGCLIGVAVSWGLLQIASVLAGELMNFYLSPGIVGFAIAASTVIGLVFGIGPANRAAKKRPIEALRYEG
ncbi:MAG: ABC transporter permease [Oscillospiraceae bacterium]|nr:ABC transporter permease [Oscillospiraceae bacterium]